MRSLGFSNYLILPVALGPGDFLDSNRNEYHKTENNYFWKLEHGRRVRLITSPPSLSRLSRKCEIFDVSQRCRSPQPVTGTALLFLILVMSEQDSLSTISVEDEGLLPKINHDEV
jgi:hypothetical protein